MDKNRLRQIRGAKISYVFQEPATSLNPVFRIGYQIKEALQLHRPDVATDEEVVRLLTLVHIPEPARRMRDYPHQLSGGMQQRVMIAMALACQPALLVADEPTTALDVTIQAQILDLLKELKAKLGMAILLITHNLGIVGDLADQRGGDVRGPDRRAVAGLGTFAQAAASVHAGVDALDSKTRRATGTPAVDSW